MNKRLITADFHDARRESAALSRAEALADLDNLTGDLGALIRSHRHLMQHAAVANPAHCLQTLIDQIQSQANAMIEAAHAAEMALIAADEALWLATNKDAA